MPTFLCEHTFKTALSIVKFEAVVTKACRSPFDIELTAHDPGMIPAMRLFTIGFYSLEDRDRVRIALRFLEKDQPAAAPAANHATAAAASTPTLPNLQFVGVSASAAIWRSTA